MFWVGWDTSGGWMVEVRRKSKRTGKVDGDSCGYPDDHDNGDDLWSKDP